ncbi:MAG TPA: hypothetical protein VHJ20_24775 [Polyangia bacterium]|nr:hypothetical protein [Polyangia bacterium]
MPTACPAPVVQRVPVDPSSAFAIVLPFPAAGDDFVSVEVVQPVRGTAVGVVLDPKTLSS